jgi:hypothetical protein
MSGTWAEINLDRLCAEAGDDIARAASGVFNDPQKAGTLLTKALGVVQEQGLYAFFLFLASRGTAEARGAEKIRDGGVKLLQAAGLVANSVALPQVLASLRRDDGLLARLDDLVLGVELVSRALTYARFHAKAMRGPGVSSGPRTGGD